MKNTITSGLPVPPSKTVPTINIPKSSSVQLRKKGSRQRLWTIRSVGSIDTVSPAAVAIPNRTSSPARLGRSQVRATYSAPRPPTAYVSQMPAVIVASRIRSADTSSTWASSLRTSRYRRLGHSPKCREPALDALAGREIASRGGPAGRSVVQHGAMANVWFSVCAGLASLAVAVAGAVAGDLAVAVVWAALAVGFAVRGTYGWRRLRR